MPRLQGTTRSYLLAELSPCIARRPPRRRLRRVFRARRETPPRDCFRRRCARSSLSMKPSISHRCIARLARERRQLEVELQPRSHARPPRTPRPKTGEARKKGETRVRIRPAGDVSSHRVGRRARVSGIQYVYFDDPVRLLLRRRGPFVILGEASGLFCRKDPTATLSCQLPVL